ncbi:MAG: CAP domain-containing protein, partial [Actinomycetota bacterium]
MQAAGLRNYARFALVAALVVGLLSFIPAKAEAAVSTSEKQMVTLINKARASAGRAPLAMSSVLSTLARKHSATMASKNKLYHNPYLAKWLSPYSWRIAGENVGVGGSITQLHTAFMKSPGHRANNLSKAYKKVGVGVVTKNGRIWITV